MTLEERVTKLEQENVRLDALNQIQNLVATYAFYHAANMNTECVDLFATKTSGVAIDIPHTDAQKASIEIWNTSDYEYGFSSDITMTAEETEDFNAAYSDIKTYVAENTLNFILGATPLDDEHWNAYVAAVEDMGIDHCIEIKQQGLTRYLNRS